MSKMYVITTLLVLCLLLPGPVVLSLGHPDSEVLAGANLNLSFARRSRVLGGFHNGTDYRADNFTPVVAAKEGTVSYIDNHCPDPTQQQPNPCPGGGYGNVIYVDHGSGYQTRYAHLAQSGFNVWVGKAVARGEQMALSDNSGNSTGPHLHFELRVNGTPVDPYAGATHWAGSDPFPIGYRDQNGAVHGPFPLDNAKIRNAWVPVARRLGSPIGNDFSYPCLAEGTQATGYMQDFERGYIFYCGGGAAQVAYYATTFLPRIIANEDANAWNSTLSIRNLGTAPANVSISFLRSNGTVLDSRLYAGLPVNATWELRASTVVFDWLVNEGSTFQGSAVVASDQDVAVIVRTEKSKVVTAYTGVSSLNPDWGQPGTTLYAPVSMYNPWGLSWKTTLFVQNTTNSETAMTIQYCRSDNPTDCQNETDPTILPPYGSRAYQPNEMGTGFFGSARIYNAGRPVAAVVTQEDDTPRASDYNTFASGQTAIYLPSMMRHWPNCGGQPPFSDCWESSFTVQNLGSAATNVTIRYYEPDGTFTDRGPLTLAAKATHLVVLWDTTYGPPGNPTDPWVGSVGLIAGQPLVAVANQEREDILTHQSYNSAAGGGTALYGPFAANDYGYGGYTYVSCSQVQNLGDLEANVTRWYYDWSGAQVWQTEAYRIPPRGSHYFYVPGEPGGPPSGFGGSVKITRSASVIIGIHNLARLHNGNKEDDYGASYNLVQR